MYRRSVLAVFSIAILLLCRTNTVTAGDPKQENLSRLSSIQTNDDFRPFLINNIFNYYGNSGSGAYNKFSSSNEGFELNKGEGRYLFFQDGTVWGGFHKDPAVLKVGGSTYRTGLQAGKVISTGSMSTLPVADASNDARYRVYRVRPDIHPATPFDFAMELKLQNEEADLIARYQSIDARTVYDQYIADWNEWPVAEGAPFTDINHDGMYSPSIDIPGEPGADQTLWYVANDLSVARVQSAFESLPIGIEMQKTIWGYRVEGEAGNVVFSRTRLVNKSGTRIDSMFVGQWADPDLGDAGDDFVGCDTTLSLGYVYNAGSVDATWGQAVPAGGHMVLQGPVTNGAPTDTLWNQGKPLPGKRYMEMSAFEPIYYVTIFDLPSPYSAQKVYWRMNGRTADSGIPMIDPTTSRETRYALSGDPLTGNGWLDASGGGQGRGDRSYILSAGPFSMAAGDTQDFVVAQLAARGSDRLSSVARLKSLARQVRLQFRTFHNAAIPKVQADVTYPDSTHAAIHMSIDAKSLTGTVKAVRLRRSDGVALPDISVVDEGKMIYGADVTLARYPQPLEIEVDVASVQGAVGTVRAGSVTTAGPLEISLQRIFSDNINSDGIVNQGEDIRFGIMIRNRTEFALTDLTVKAWKNHRMISMLGPGGLDSVEYDAARPGSYFELVYPERAELSYVDLDVNVTDPTGNHWAGSVRIDAVPLLFPVRQDTVHHAQGKCDGSFGIYLLDPLRFNNHLYVIRGLDSINAQAESGFMLKDSTDGRVLFATHELPDTLGHTMMPADGFKLLRGTIPLNPGRMKSWSIPHGQARWTYLFGATSLLNLEGMSGSIGNAAEHWFSGGVPLSRQHDVLIRFAATDSNGNPLNNADSLVSYAYRYLQNANAGIARPEFAPFVKNPGAGFAYQDYTRSLPFAAYAVDVTPPSRLMVGFLENNVSGGSVDGRYWPPRMADNVMSSSPREWFFIFDEPYSETPLSLMQADISMVRLPLMWVGTPARKSAGGFSPNNQEDQFLIESFHGVSSEDMWVFQLRRDAYVPTAFTLSQNFPNPFNPSTSIRCALPEAGEVRVTIYDLLGREVTTLTAAATYAGEITLQWAGTDAGGRTVASGVYFYRIQATGSKSQAVFSDTKKMLLLR